MPLLRKALATLSQEGFFGLTIKVLNRILVPSLGLNLILQRDVPRQKFSAPKKAFGKSVLTAGEHFSYLVPSPSREDLEDYYQSVYWDSRGGLAGSVQIRDLIHYSILQEHIGDELVPGASFLNFGAGHGGISHLLWNEGLNVRNVDFAPSPGRYSQRFATSRSLEEVPNDSVDIIYGSHSLEHVHDIDSFIAEVERVLRPSATMFWEVPNCEILSQQVKDPPHTYYFRRSFFENWFARVLLLDSFSNDATAGVDQWELARSPSGEYLRALGKLGQ